ncbi:hypothetical protein ANANG_G00115960, partial [Anguilla anguilla]
MYECICQSLCDCTSFSTTRRLASHRRPRELFRIGTHCLTCKPCNTCPIVLPNYKYFCLLLHRTLTHITTVLLFAFVLVTRTRQSWLIWFSCRPFSTAHLDLYPELLAVSLSSALIAVILGPEEIPQPCSRSNNGIEALWRE